MTFLAFCRYFVLKRGNDKSGKSQSVLNITSICNFCLRWCERWPVWGYVGIESAQSSVFLLSIAINKLVAGVLQLPCRRSEVDYHL